MARFDPNRYKLKFRLAKSIQATQTDKRNHLL